MTSAIRTENELVEEVEGMSSVQRAELRLRCCEDLFFLCRGVLGFKDVNLATHGAFINFIVNEPKYYRLSLMPRFHLKTTIATEADSLRLGLRNPDHERILIVNEIEQNALDILAAIRGHMEKNQLLRLLFSDVIPERTSGPGIQWSSIGASLVRRTSWKEPTWMALGIKGAAVSKHFTRVKADDLIGLEAKKSPAKMREAIGWVDNSQSLVVGADQTVFDFIGTRWLKRDVYGHIIKLFGRSLAVFRRQVVEGGKIIFPAKINQEFITRLLEQTPDIYFAQFLNNPQSEEALDWNEGDLREFAFGPNRCVMYQDGPKRVRWEFDELDRVIAVDPNGGGKQAPDEAAIEVVGQAPDEHRFDLDDWGGRPDPTELVDKIFEKAKQWRPRVIGIEETQAQTLHHFKKKMRDEGLYFNVVPLKHKNRNKEDRIRSNLNGPIKGHRYHAQRKGGLRDQLKDFPDIANDDRIDARSYAEEILIIPQARQGIEERNDAVQRVLDARDSQTGY